MVFLAAKNAKEREGTQKNGRAEEEIFYSSLLNFFPSFFFAFLRVLGGKILLTL
jgi:hypothetical protein